MHKALGLDKGNNSREGRGLRNDKLGHEELPKSADSWPSPEAVTEGARAVRYCHWHEPCLAAQQGNSLTVFWKCMNCGATKTKIHHWLPEWPRATQPFWALTFSFLIRKSSYLTNSLTMRVRGCWSIFFIHLWQMRSHLWIPAWRWAQPWVMHVQSWAQWSKPAGMSARNPLGLVMTFGSRSILLPSNQEELETNKWTRPLASGKGKGAAWRKPRW